MKVVVIGGGIAGLLVAKKLGATLVTDSEHFVFLPRLPELLRQGPPTATIPIRECHDDVVIGTADVDVHNKQVIVDGNKIGYDELVIATGAKAKSPVPGVSTYAHMLYSLEDAKKLKQTGSNNHVVIMGAGPTGVELAMELAGANAVTLLQRGARIIPTFSDKTARYAKQQLIDAGVELRVNEEVQRVSAKHVVTSDDKYRYDVAVWTAGVSARNPAGLETKGALPVNEYLQVKGSDHIWAVGDCAATGSPLTAQAAQQEALHVVKNITRKHRVQKLKPFRFHNKGDFLLLGDNAVMDSFVTLTGKLPAWIRYAYYQLQLRRYRL